MALFRGGECVAVRVIKRAENVRHRCDRLHARFTSFAEYAAQINNSARKAASCGLAPWNLPFRSSSQSFLGRKRRHACL